MDELKMITEIDCGSVKEIVWKARFRVEKDGGTFDMEGRDGRW